MPNIEIFNAAGLVYRPSVGRSDLPKQSMLWSALRLSGLDAAAGPHGLVTMLSRDTAHIAPPMTSETLRPLAAPARQELQKSLDEVLFDSRAMAKIAASRVSMYLREGWRDKLFYQLDNLLEPEEWDPEDKPLQAQSFDTFLKAICDVNPSKRPGLGLSYAGNLIAVWRSNVNTNDRVSLEFMPDGRVKLIGSRFVQDEPVSFSALTPVAALKQTLVDMSCVAWLGCDYAQKA
jgi:hypothetical protein